jgi:MFS transporter, PPP family, 3-phenylpropionic acid transporter
MAVVKVLAPTAWAYVADRTGARVAVIRAGIGGAIVCVAALMGDFGFWWLVVVLALHGLFSTAILPQVETVTLARLGAGAKQYGRIRLWGSVGFVAAVVATGWLTETFGLSLLPVVVIGCQVVALLATALLADPDDIGHSAQAAPLGPVIRQAHVVVFLFVAMLMAASHAPYYSFFSIQLGDLGYSRTTIGILWAFAVVAEVILFSQGGWLLARFTLVRLLGAALAVTALRWLVMGYFADVEPALWFAQGAHAISFGLFHLASIEYVRRSFVYGTQGRGQALYSALGFGLGAAVGSAGAGTLWASGGPQVAYLWAALACGVALAALLLAFSYAKFPAVLSQIGEDR